MLGWPKEPEEFYVVLIDYYIDTYWADHPSVERFLCHPEKAIAYCKVIREMTKLPDLDDSDILLCLLNQRKQKQIHLRLTERGLD